MQRACVQRIEEKKKKDDGGMATASRKPIITVNLTLLAFRLPVVNKDNIRRASSTHCLEGGHMKC